MVLWTLDTVPLLHSPVGTRHTGTERLELVRCEISWTFEALCSTRVAVKPSTAALADPILPVKSTLALTLF